MAENYKKTLDYIPIHSAEYLNKLQEYDFLERGAFASIVHLCVITNMELPSDDKIYRRLGAYTDEEKKSIDSVFEEAKSFILPIIERQQGTRQKRADAGRAGGKSNNKTKPKPGLSKIEAKEKQMLKQNASIETDTDTETEKETDTEKETNNKSVTLKEIKESFDIFYEAYPKHLSRGQAETTFAKVIKKQNIETVDELSVFSELLIDAIKLQLIEHENKNPGADYKYWQNPSTWLNAGGWLNEVDLRLPNQQQHPKSASDRNSNYISMLKDAEQRLLNQQKIGENK